MRVLAAVVLAVTLLATRAGAAPEEVPDAQLLLDLDLFTHTEPEERDLVRRMSIVERLRLLEMLRVLDPRPAAPATGTAPTDGRGR
jgi:hypothetical protein